ncbi:MAG: acetoin dehydrogenase [Lentisphaerae bacterium GWF2_45_14]|nr:MAG: acetoin dehydrogenase [Lentisphaerae bacterium GWF2_45_14]
MTRSISYAHAVNEALSQAMKQDKNVICYGLGIPDPKGVFGTSSGLQEQFGSERVFDMPTSENAMTGIAIGAALNGIRPVMTHQRLDFFLLAMDQLVNNAAKWHYMFGGASSIPITIRLILGMGWGQGPTHSQNLQSWFAHIPGLKVVMPTTPEDAKGLLLSSIFDDNPVVFLEHRWLHNQDGNVPENPSFRVPIGKAKILRAGTQITIAGMSYMNIEALRAIAYLQTLNISCELIDIRSFNPIDWNTIFNSVRKTGHLLVLDTGSETCSVAGEIIARVSMEVFSSLKAPPARLALPDIPTPTSFALTKYFYKNAKDIVAEVAKQLHFDLPHEIPELEKKCPHDVPGNWFKGPF